MGEQASLALFAGMFLLAMSGLVWLIMERGRLRRRLGELERLPTRLAHLVLLVRSMSASDWTSSAKSLLRGIVGADRLEYGALLSLSDNDNLEERVSHGLAPTGYAACLDPQAIAAQKSATMNTDPVEGVAYIPVVEENQVVGILVVRGPGLIGVQVQEGGLEAQPPLLLYLTAAAELTGVALAGIRAFQKQAALSHTDGLTGLLNHRQFHQVLGVQISQAYLFSKSVTLVLFDIDHFKQVNDTYGHLTGDLVLRELSNLIRRSAPPGSIAARYGGEEFALLLPGIPLEEACQVAEGLRKQVEQHTIFDYATGNRINVTISLGVGQFPLGLGKSQFIGAVDVAMYASKRSGRNRLTVADLQPIEVGAENQAQA